MRLKPLPALLLAVVTLAAGCGDDSATTTTTSSASTTTTAAGLSTTIAPTTTAATSTTADAEVPLTLDLDDLSLYLEPAGLSYRDLSLYLEPAGLSYRTTLDFHFFTDTPNTVEGRMLAEGGHLVGPPEVVDLIARAEGDATGPQCFQFSISPGFTNPYDAFLEDGGMLMGEASLLAKGVETNGRVVDRYAITMDNIDPTDDAGSEVDDLAQGWIDVDREGGFVVELFLEGLGRSSLLTGSSSLQGDIDYTLDYSEFGTITELLTDGFC